MSLARRVALSLVAAAVVAGCFILPGGPTGLVIDGVPVGEAQTCAELGLSDNRCALVFAAARQRLDQRSPGHADVVRAELFARADAASDAGPALAIDTRFSLGVVVLSLADGSRRAVEILCNPGRGSIEPACVPDR